MKKINKKSASLNINTEEVLNRDQKTINKKVDLARMIPVVILLLVLVAVAYGYYRYGSIATVNGKPISRIDYIKTLEKQGGKQVVDQMIQETLILDEAKKKGVTIDQNIINEEIGKIETQLKDQGQTLDEALLKEGMTRADLEKQIRLQKLVQQLADSKKEITQAEIDSFLTQNKDQLPKGATKQELDDLAKKQIESQAANQNVTSWLENLKKEATIVYK